MTFGIGENETPAPGRLGRYVQGLDQGNELPMFSEQLLELLSLSIEEPTEARKLVELVGEDYALTCKVLQIANSFHYNRSNHPIESLSHAIVVLGAGTVQNLASTLACFQSSEQRSVVLQHLMIRSMVSAQVAAVTAEFSGFKDREVAYLAGMLQNLGEILVAHHSPVHHAAIEGHVKAGYSRDDASLKEMGFAFDALASVVGRRWKLSPRVCSLWDPSSASTDLTTLARFANELTRVMTLGAVATQKAGVSLLLMRYGWSLRLTAEEIAEVWDRALAETRQTFDSLGVSVSSLSLPTVHLAACDHQVRPPQVAI
jgi:HD-like signal output (HDOD) protein